MFYVFVPRQLFSRRQVPHSPGLCFTALEKPLGKGVFVRPRSGLVVCLVEGVHTGSFEISSVFIIFKFYSRLLVIRWWYSGKSRTQRQIKVIYPNILRLICTVLISVTCSSAADG